MKISYIFFVGDADEPETWGNLGQKTYALKTEDGAVTHAVQTAESDKVPVHVFKDDGENIVGWLTVMPYVKE